MHNNNAQHKTIAQQGYRLWDDAHKLTFIDRWWEVMKAESVIVAVALVGAPESLLTLFQ